jgi:GAF domain-containing protein
MSDLTARLRDAAETVEELRTLLDDEEPVDRVLGRLAEMAARTVPAAAGVSITVLTADGRTARTPAATDDLIVAVDGVQYDAGDGPCLEAARTRRPVRVSVDEIRGRWPAFARAAGDAGMRAFLSAPLLLDDAPVLGALNVYGRDVDAFDPVDEALIGLFTSAASGAIVNARRYRRARELVGHLKIALTSRAEIEQAKGVLISRHAITADAAFAWLARRSSDTNTKLRDVARSVLDSTNGSPRSA